MHTKVNVKVSNLKIGSIYIDIDDELMTYSGTDPVGGTVKYLFYRSAIQSSTSFSEEFVERRLILVSEMKENRCLV